MRRLGRLLATALVALQGSAAIAAPGFPAVAAAPAGAPNILIVMTDDVGYGASSTFGGAIPTPTFDALARDGLRYANFHTTALCSPTRAALLTGRNHHAVGFGSVADLARGQPGYTSIIPKSAGTIGQIFSAAGYDTAWLGKNHNVPTWQSGPLGPYDQWGSGLGFRYFYGFNGGLTDQFAPALIENDRMIEPPREPGYILDRDLADHAIGWLRMQRTQGGGRPFLLYIAPGTAHAPIHAPADWIARFRGKFDAGWDVYRRETLARQKRLGLVPADAELPPLPANVKPWDTLTSDEKRVHARYMEAYAAALAYCDAQIGRVIAELRASGRLDNTIVIYIQGDNGASGEGGEHGAFDYAAKVSGGLPPAEELAHALSHIDAIGGPRSYAVAPAPWGFAMDTPYPYTKVVASRLGGTTNGMVISWPAGLKARGLRRQFTDVTDIAPTLLELTGIAPPATLGGVAQQPFDGTSFAATLARADAPSRHMTQYFEIMGHAAIYHDGWMAASPVVDRGDAGNSGAAPDRPWQLYDLTRDFNQTIDVAASHPDKLAELKTLWDAEAARNKVLPLATVNVQAILPQSRPEIMAAAGRYVFHPADYRYTEGTFPSINNRSWSIDADLDVPAGGADGMLVTQGGRFGGWGLLMLGGRPTFVYRRDDRDEAMLRIAAAAPLPPGHHRVTVRFTVDGPGFGRGGAIALLADGHEVAAGRLERTVPFKFSPEDAAVGHDTGTPIIDGYRLPFAYAGTLDALAIELGAVQLPPPRPDAVSGANHD